MDQIGIVCRSPEEGFKALKIIAGFDPKDGAMLPAEVNQAEAPKTQESHEPQRTNEPPKPQEPPKTQQPQEPPTNIRTAEITPKCSEIYTQIMQILCCAELSNNISRYDGIKYGYRAKDYQGLRGLYTKTRTEAFELDIKLAAMIGAMVLSQENYERYYDKAMRLRRLIKESLEFDKYDIICAPHAQPTPENPTGIVGRDALGAPSPVPSSPKTLPAQHDPENPTGIVGGAAPARPSPSLLTQTAALTQATPVPPLITLSRLCGLPSITTPEYIYVANTKREDILEAMCKTQTNAGAGI